MQRAMDRGSRFGGQPTNQRDSIALPDVLRHAGLGSFAELVFTSRNFAFPGPVVGGLFDKDARWSAATVTAWKCSDDRAQYRQWRRAL